MNKFGGRLTQRNKLIFTLSIFCVFTSCKNSHKNFEYLINSGGANKTEVTKIVAFYNQQTQRDKLVMTEYLLDNLPKEYRLKYYILSKAGLKQPISENISIDSTDSLRCIDGNSLEIDTLWSIKTIKASLIIHQINRADSLRKLYKWFGDIPLKQYCKYVLPYQINNEGANDYKNFYEKRYLKYLNDVLVKNLDTLFTLRSYLDPFFSSTFFPAVNQVNFTSNPILDKMADGCKNCADNEDLLTFNIHALRSIGVPSTYEYLPYVKDRQGPLMRIDIRGKDQHTHFSAPNKWPYKFRIAKCYANSSDYKSAGNPFRELLNLGVPIENIPFNLNIPKSEDVTDQRTTTKTIELNLPDNLYTQKILYLAVYNQDRWKIVAYGKINSLKNTVSLNKIGCEIIYHLATYKRGEVRLIGKPFSIDSLGVPQNFAPFPNQVTTLRLTKINEQDPILPGGIYNLSYFENGLWKEAKNQIAANDSLIVHDIPKNTIYCIQKVLPGSNKRLFTYQHEKQVWR